jgi:hypothetical protein
MSDLTLVEKGQMLLDGAANIRKNFSASVNREISDPAELHEALVRARTATDQLELALIHGMNLLRAAEIELDTKRAMVEDAEINALSGVKGTQFSSAKEKSVEFNLRTLEERRAEREALNNYKQAKHVVDVLRLLHKGVDSARYDLKARLDAVTLTRSIERG